MLTLKIPDAKIGLHIEALSNSYPFQCAMQDYNHYRKSEDNRFLLSILFWLGYTCGENKRDIESWAFHLALKIHSYANKNRAVFADDPTFTD